MKSGLIFNAVLAIALVTAGVLLVRSGERTATAAESAAQSAKQSANAAQQIAGSMDVLATQARLPHEARQERRVARSELGDPLDARTRYLAALKGHTQANFLLPEGLTTARCSVRVKQLPNGQIVAYSLLESCGSEAADEAVEKAIRASSPLPRAPKREVFESEIVFQFHYP